MTVKNRSLGYARASARAKARAKAKTPKVISEDGDFYLEQPDFPSYHTWRISNQSGENLRGVFYGDSKRNYTFLHRHEVEEDWLSTTEHENIHAGIFQCIEWSLLLVYLTDFQQNQELLLIVFLLLAQLPSIHYTS